MKTLEENLRELRAWFDSERFAGIIRLYSPRQVAEQRGSIAVHYPVARDAAAALYARLRQLYAERRAITTFGPYSPSQAVTIKRMGIEAIYLGGWATSAKGSVTEDPGADLASYPLSQVPDEAATIVRALLTADRNQQYQRAQMSDKQRQETPVIDYRPFIIADADTGHGGDAHVRNLIRRFVEAGVPGYHIEDQRPGTKKCGHQGGKVLVSCDEQIKRLNAARFQLDVMGVAGIIVARTDAEAANLIDSRADERDQPFILGSTNVNIPSYRVAFAAMLRQLHQLGLTEFNGYLLYGLSAEELAAAEAWLERSGLTEFFSSTARAYRERPDVTPDGLFDRVTSRFVEQWELEAGLHTYGEAVAEVLEFRAAEGEIGDSVVAEWRQFARAASFSDARRRARSLGVSIVWDCEHARTPDGYFQVQGGIEYAIAKSLAVAPFADILWMETATANLDEARHFAESIHAVYPDKMLAYNLSPSFNWDSTGMSDEAMRRFPEELGKLGFVFNFITYGGHQIDGVAAEEFATALRQDGMLALARVQRKLRLLESPYRTPQTLVGGPRIDAALAACSGRTATTKAMGKGSTQHQHLLQIEVPKKLLEAWLEEWSAHYQLPDRLKVDLKPYRAGSELLELSLRRGNEKVANVIFAAIQDRQGRVILSVRDQNTFDETLRKKRLMTLVHLWLVHRYKAESLHYVTPTEDNRYQAGKMKEQGLFAQVSEEVGQIIVAEVNGERVAALLHPDRVALGRLIRKEA